MSSKTALRSGFFMSEAYKTAPTNFYLFVDKIRELCKDNTMKKFLVIQLARFGDIIQSKRLILALQEQGEVSLLIDNSLAALAKLVYPSVRCLGVHASSALNQNVWQENLKLFHFLQSEQFDEIYPLNHSPLSQAISTLFEPERLTGYSRHNGYTRQSLWVKMAFRWLGSRKKTPINLVDFWGLLTEKPYPADKVNPKAQGKRNGLGIVLSGQNARRSLSPEIYAKIISIVYNRLLKENRLHDKNIYLLGTKKEEQYAQKLLSCLSSSLLPCCKNLAGKTTFQDLNEILQGLELLLSPDTGTAHFAAHLGTPVEGFFLSSANLFETGPYGAGHTVWQANLTCTPCMEFQNCLHKDNNVPDCLNAFSDPHFLYHLLHKSFDDKNLAAKPLQAVIPYFAGFADSNKFSAFLSWQSPVKLPQDIAREREKHVLENYCLASKDTASPFQLHNITDNAIYAETDWMLPQNKP